MCKNIVISTSAGPYVIDTIGAARQFFKTVMSEPYFNPEDRNKDICTYVIDVLSTAKANGYDARDSGIDRLFTESGPDRPKSGFSSLLIVLLLSISLFALMNIKTAFAFAPDPSYKASSGTIIDTPMPGAVELIPSTAKRIVYWTDGVSALEIHSTQDGEHFYLKGSVGRFAEHAVVGPLPRDVYGKFLHVLKNGGRIGRKKPFRTVSCGTMSDGRSRFLTFRVERTIPGKTWSDGTVKSAKNNAKNRVIRRGIDVIMGRKLDIDSLIEDVGEGILGGGVRVKTEERTLPAEKVMVEMTVTVAPQDLKSLINAFETSGF